MLFYKQLVNAVLEEDYFRTEEVLKMIINQDDSLEYVDSILKFMEENPDIDYGMPGPVVHYMERFFLKGYEESLYESICRKPTIHTLWMLNRLLNSANLVNREKYISILNKIANSQDQSEIVRNEAIDYLNYQNSK